MQTKIQLAYIKYENMKCTLISRKKCRQKNNWLAYESKKCTLIPRKSADKNPIMINSTLSCVSYEKRNYIGHTKIWSNIWPNLIEPENISFWSFFYILPKSILKSRYDKSIIQSIIGTFLVIFSTSKKRKSEN